ncbi:DUF3524 domain-containing protein [Desulfococcaceae bacterium HSG8]|nr:DUF3524 domain-containing protein [Desulfococcaceae bacterium HSG8]
MNLKFLFLEPFFGGSHRDFAEGLIANSRHEIHLLTLPARFWKWRMRGASLYFLKKISVKDYDGLITTDLMSLSDFKALCKPTPPPALTYFHESQLTYPLAPGEHMDFQFGFTDITTGLAADRVLFNSHTHFNSFFSTLPGFLKMMPEYRPGWVTDEIRSKSSVLCPGCRFPAEKEALLPPDSRPPLIIWNHRWEFDKNPGDFFAALDAVLDRGTDFRLALLGENFQVVPKPFIHARERYGSRIIQYGYLESGEDYVNMLKQGSIVISTAKQENFGISVVEAIRRGCLPLLPNRLAYPEVIPEKFHSDFLYENQDELVEKLCFLTQNYSEFQEKREELSDAMGCFAWENMIDLYDEELEKLVAESYTD